MTLPLTQLLHLGTAEAVVRAGERRLPESTLRAVLVFLNFFLSIVSRSQRKQLGKSAERTVCFSGCGGRRLDLSTPKNPDFNARLELTLARKLRSSVA